MWQVCFFRVKKGYSPRLRIITTFLGEWFGQVFDSWTSFWKQLLLKNVCLIWTPVSPYSFRVQEMHLHRRWHFWNLTPRFTPNFFQVRKMMGFQFATIPPSARKPPKLRLPFCDDDFWSQKETPLPRRWCQGWNHSCNWNVRGVFGTGFLIWPSFEKSFGSNESSNTKFLNKQKHQKKQSHKRRHTPSYLTH